MHTEMPESFPLSPTDKEKLFKELQQRASRRYHFDRRRKLFSRISLGGCFLCTLPHLPEFGSLVPTWIQHIPFLRPLGECFFLAFLAAALPELATLLGGYFSQKRLRSLIEALQKEVRTIGPLALLCERQYQFSVTDRAVEALLTLLPEMQPEDFRRLSDSEMKGLLTLLNGEGHSAWDPERFQKSAFYRFALSFAGMRAFNDKRIHQLPRAILKALERSGDSRAIGAVRRLATSRLNNQHRREAQECLAFLEQQAEVRDRQRNLLLPSAPHQAQENLLRPTVPQAEAQPELLLRAATDREHL